MWLSSLAWHQVVLLVVVVVFNTILMFCFVCYTGVWKSRKELKKLRKVERCFYPTTNKELIDRQKAELNMWVKAANRFKSWTTTQ